MPRSAPQLRDDYRDAGGRATQDAQAEHALHGDTKPQPIGPGMRGVKDGQRRMGARHGREIMGMARSHRWFQQTSGSAAVVRKC